jgi:CBS domain-containing protein
MVSDKGFLSWFSKYAKGSAITTPLATDISASSPSDASFSRRERRTLRSPLERLLSRSLYELAFPLLNIHTAVVAASSVATVLDAMRLMSEEGVSSVAVLDEESGILLGAVSVTDIGQVSLLSVFRFLFEYLF